MPDLYHSYNCFISSPSDVAEERQIARDAIAHINRTCLEPLRISLNVVDWEHPAPVTPPLPDQTIQNTLNKQVEKADFFILILYKRYGSKEVGETRSNTERETDIILQRLAVRPGTQILTYFRELPSNGDQGEQEKGVRTFRAKLETTGVRYKLYKNPGDFQIAFIHDIYESILKLGVGMASHKKECLQHFWQFGIPERNTHPKLAVIYPPVNRHYSDPIKDKDFWLKRLEPNIYFEDHKALEKIGKTLGLVGFHDYRVFPSTHIPADIQYMNCVWICMPRSIEAKASLQTHRAQACFSFGESTPTRSATIKWRDKVVVYSPLNLYLREQRNRMDITGEAHQQLSHIVAKDYAILARFSKGENDARDLDGALQDYYIAGIRGLGTWGAAWFLDRRYRNLKGFSEENDIQLLLEVIYHDGRIFDVKDVSDKPAEYFKEQNLLTTIRQEIKNRPLG